MPKPTFYAVYVPNITYGRILTFELFFGGIFCTTTPIVTQSPSISLFPLIFVGICEIFTILRPSILFSITTDGISGLIIRKLENLSFEKLSSSIAVLVLVSTSLVVVFFDAPTFPSERFLRPGPWLIAVFEPFGFRSSVGFFSVDVWCSPAFCFVEL